MTNTTKTNQLLRLATDFRDYYPQNLQDQVICDLDDEFGQFGVYNIKVSNLTTCHVDVVKEPVNAYSRKLSSKPRQIVATSSTMFPFPISFSITHLSQFNF